MAEGIFEDSLNLDAMDAAPAYQAAMRKLVVAQMGLKEGRVLDFGAGSGAYSRAVAAATGWTVSALEPYSVLHNKIGPGIEVLSSFEDIPPASFDGAFSLNVLEHILDDAGALLQLAVRCRPNAPIFVLVPAHMSLWTPMDDRVGHVRRYSCQELNRLAQRAGLKIERQGWFDATGFVATRAYQALGKFMGARRLTGEVSKGQLQAFDTVFSIAEPLLTGLKVPLGKNCWALLRVPAALPGAAASKHGSHSRL